jgi:RNA-binding protein
MKGKQSRNSGGAPSKRKFGVKKKLMAKDVVARPGNPGKPPEKLSSGQRKHLRGLAHPLKPIVLLGKEGITEGIVRTVQEALIDHELIKVKLLQSCPLDKNEAAVRISQEAGALLVQLIGKTCVLYAPHPNNATIKLPKA